MKPFKGGSDLAFLPPLESSAAGPVRLLSPEEIEEYVPQIRPRGQRPFVSGATYHRSGFEEPKPRKWGGQHLRRDSR